jgi:hypothetical protein
MIRIDCTCQKDLTINNKKINNKSYANSKFSVKSFDFINKVSILYEDSLHSNNDLCFITKTLEFLCNREITEEEFAIFITYMKDNGFISKRKEPKIQFINNENRIIYNYDYNLGIPFNKNSVKSMYKYQNLYVKYNIA